jgi:methylenetetrahydrofolate reductase (NADPH)
VALGLPSTLPGGHPAIGDLVRDSGPTFSFEFSPPRTVEGERQLWQAIRELEPLRPSFVSITYGAGGTTRDTTVSVTERVATETTLLPMAHLTAVNHSVAELRNVVGRLANVGVSNILVVRGDPPGDPTADWVPHPKGVLYAEDLVRIVRDAGDFSVGVAAFPYKHPRSQTVDADTEYFVRKCRAGADFAITQMFFDAEDYLRLRDRVAVAGGADIPIIAGIMPVTNIGTIERSEQLSGAPFPRELADRFRRIGDDPAAVRQLGIEHASAMSARLLAEGVPGIHFITFNRSTATREVWQNLALGARV